MNKVQCPVCGSEIVAGDLFCANCGTRLISSSEQEKREQQVMESEEQQNVLNPAQKERPAGAQTQWSDEEKDYGEQDESSSHADHSEVITVSFSNEHIEQSLDLFLDTIASLPNEPLKRKIGDTHAIVDRSISLQEARSIAADQLEQNSPALAVEQQATSEEQKTVVPTVEAAEDEWEEQAIVEQRAMSEEQKPVVLHVEAEEDEREEQATVKIERLHELPISRSEHATTADSTTTTDSVDTTGTTTSSPNTADSMGAWKTYTNSWYGFVLELPTAWQVSTQNGMTRVASSLQGEQAIEHALVRFTYLPTGVSARDVAQAWVQVLRETWATMEVHIIPAHLTTGEREPAQIVHIAGTLSQAAMKGMFVVQVYDKLALISGFQVRSGHMSRMAPIFHRILSSFASIKKVRRRRYIDEDERAYTGYVPADWAVQARLRRIPTAERTPLVDFQASDATKTASVAIPPTYEVYSEDPLMTHDDVVGYRRVMSATRFIEELLIPRYQARKAHMHVESVDNCAERSQETNRKQGQGGTLFDVAALQYSYDDGGETYRERIVLQIMHTPVIATWTVQMVSRCRAPAEQFVSLNPFFTGILETRRSSESWKRQERARVEERLREAQKHLASASASYIQAMYALSGSAKPITEHLRVSMGLAREADTQTRSDEIVPLLHDTSMETDGSISYDLPAGFEMYWKDAPEASLEEYESKR